MSSPMLFSAGAKGNLYVWSILDGSLIKVFRGHHRVFCSAAPSSSCLSCPLLFFLPLLPALPDSLPFGLTLETSCMFVCSHEPAS
eukprot:756736-Hanusia_phi.AAC.1